MPVYILWMRWGLNMDFRLGFGPMSREVIEILCNYSHNNKKPLMIIASRNQVDAESGYDDNSTDT